MNTGISSIITVGFDGIVIDIECQFSNSLPSIVIVGLGSKAVDESKERIRSAFASSSIQLPRKRITINLAPADIPKESTSLDLAIAAAIIAANNKPSVQSKERCLIIGEVGLNGAVRPVRGIIGKLIAAQKLGFSTFFIPTDNVAQATLVPSINLFPVANLEALQKHLMGIELLPSLQTDQSRRTKPTHAHRNSLSSISGQQQAKRALEIAAAGGHNLLLAGPPGTGKSMLAKAAPSLLPPLTHQEMLEVTHIHSLASNKYDELVHTRPFRSPHHSSSHISIVGGGANTRPGEVTLSHRGILFLDEVPEYSRQTLEALRQPLEDKVITVARAKQTVEYPANFILIATANPCPCGYYGSNKDCTCSTAQIMRYQRKLSGPIMDRIDLFVEVSKVEHDKLLNSKVNIADDQKAQGRIAAARNYQQKRFASASGLNATMTNQDLQRHCHIDIDAKHLLNQAAQKLDISARSYMRIMKVARTIADLEKSSTIQAEHITEALQYRSLRFLLR